MAFGNCRATITSSFHDISHHPHPHPHPIHLAPFTAHIAHHGQSHLFRVRLKPLDASQDTLLAAQEHATGEGDELQMKAVGYSCCLSSLYCIIQQPPRAATRAQQMPFQDIQTPTCQTSAYPKTMTTNWNHSLLHALPPPIPPLQAQQRRVLRRQSPRVAPQPSCEGRRPPTALRRLPTSDQAAQGRQVLVAAQALC